MIRIDITPVTVVTKQDKGVSKGKETIREYQSREYSAIASRDGVVIATHTCVETVSVIPPILRLVKEAGVELGEEVIFYRGTTPVFVTMTLDHWLNPPKKPKKAKKDANSKSDELLPKASEEPVDGNGEPSSAGEDAEADG